jgi:hypothetical protein
MSSTELFSARGKSQQPKGTIMAGVALLLMVGVAAIAMLLGCLLGFSRALKHRKTRALLLRVDEASGRRPSGKVREPFLFPHDAGTANHTTLPPGGISKNTAAFVGLALLLGSRSADFDRQTRTLLQPCHRDKKTTEAGGTLWSGKSTASNRKSTERSAVQHSR